MDFELLTCLLKFIEHSPDYHSVLSRMLLRFFWTTFVETAVYNPVFWHVPIVYRQSTGNVTQGVNTL